MYVHVFTCGECIKFRTAKCPFEDSLNEPSSDNIALPECLSYPVSVVTTSEDTQHLLTTDKDGYNEQTITIEHTNYTSALERLKAIAEPAPRDWREEALKRKSNRKKRHYERILFKRRKNAKIKKLWKQSQKQEK